MKLHHCALNSYDILKWIIFKGCTCIGVFKIPVSFCFTFCCLKNVFSVPCLVNLCLISAKFSFPCRIENEYVICIKNNRKKTKTNSNPSALLSSGLKWSDGWRMFPLYLRSCLSSVFQPRLNPWGTAGSKAAPVSPAAFCKPLSNHSGYSTSGNLRRKPTCSGEVTDLSREIASQ